MVRVLLVTGRRFRHLWLIDLARRALGESVVGGVVQASQMPETPGADRLGRWRRSAKRTLARAGVDLPVYLDFTPAERHLWLVQGEPGISWQDWLDTSVQVTQDPNDEDSLAWLEQMAPDLVVVFGGKMLSQPWYERPRLGAINLHYGITPEYRGSDSVTWAAYHRNWSKIGSTIHYLDAGVDTGDVVSQIQVNVEADDDLDRLTARVYWEGMNDLVRCANEIARTGSRLPAQHIERDRSHFYPARQCTYDVRRIADRHVRQHASRMSTLNWQHYGEAPDPDASNGLQAWSEGLAQRPAERDELPAGVYILLYHDLTPADRRPWRDHAEISTEPGHFREHLRYVSDHGRWVSPDEAYGSLSRNDVTEPLFLLTFDDGFASVSEHAAPILADLGIAPLLFLNGATLAGEHVHYRVLAAMLSAEDRSDALVEAVRESAPSRLARRVPSPQMVAAWLKRTYDPAWTDRVATAAYHRHHDALPRELFLNCEQVRSLIAAGWQIGNHTWSHARLACLSPRQVTEELERNHDWLARTFGQTPKWVSYPYGFWNDLCPEALAWVEQVPERIGVMADGGVNFTLERAALRRIPIGDDDLTTFRRKLHQSILVSQQERFSTVLAPA